MIVKGIIELTYDFNKFMYLSQKDPNLKCIFVGEYTNKYDDLFNSYGVIPASILMPDYICMESQVNGTPDEFKEKYSGVFAWRVFVHFTKEDALNVLNKTYDALEDNGLFVFNVMNREGKAVDEEWVDFPNEYHMGADRYYKYFKEEEMNEIIKQTGFEVCDFHKEGGVNNNKWLVYVLKK